MTTLFHQLIQTAQQRYSENIAVQYKLKQLNYNQLYQLIEQLSQQLLLLKLEKQDRVAIYLGQTIESIISFFAISSAGGIFVPINPHLKNKQVAHILHDCSAKILITSSQRYKQLQSSHSALATIELVILVDPLLTFPASTHTKQLLWRELITQVADQPIKTTIDINERETVAILYTSGSTGKAKGVMVSHKNLIYGAKSVASYLKNNDQDKILAVLSFSFDYGLNQLTSSCYCGACLVLLEYLLAQDVIKAVIKYQITGLAGVPPLWIQLARLNWPEEANKTLRYITSSGGVMPKKTILQLQKLLSNTKIYLMYGLTEAFRSTYLEPDLINHFPHSIGKAIPNAQLLIVNAQGRPCEVDEIGELVHYGPLVANGYWNNKMATEKVFRPLNSLLLESLTNEIAVWSGDLVKYDSEGLIYFVERNDQMIKSSAYRISPTEVEDVFLQHPKIIHAIALGIAHQELGQAILLICTVTTTIANKELLIYAKKELANFMCPKDVIIESSLPQTANGKIDRQVLLKKYAYWYTEKDDNE